MVFSKQDNYRDREREDAVRFLFFPVRPLADNAGVRSMAAIGTHSA